MTAPSRTARTLVAAAKLRHAASSVVPVVINYERDLRPCLTCFSPSQSTTCAGGDRL